MSKVWYRLTNNADIDMMFSCFEMMQAYWKNLPTSKALTCHWEVSA